MIFNLFKNFFSVMKIVLKEHFKLETFVWNAIVIVIDVNTRIEIFQENVCAIIYMKSHFLRNSYFKVKIVLRYLS